MLGIDGPEICHRARARQRTPYQYLSLGTSRDSSADVVAGLEAGADDYLRKPFERNELRARLTVGRCILALQDGLIRAREELLFQATHDVLTGIWNRRAVLDLLQRELERASRGDGSTGRSCLISTIASKSMMRAAISPKTRFCAKWRGEKQLLAIADAALYRAKAKAATAPRSSDFSHSYSAIQCL
jgi:CheY-like chemotaxis protein